MGRLLSLLNGPYADFFEASFPVFVARAPGRLDVMGGIADYSGSLVLQMPLTVATFAVVQNVSEPEVTILSAALDDRDALSEVLRWSISRDTLFPIEIPLSELNAHKVLTRDPQNLWAAYIAGVLVVLRNEHGQMPAQGLRILIASEVPQGKGVSSSAALEVAMMQAMCALYDIRLEGREVALLCQRVENVVVGAPCGVMDQMTAACGEQESLLALLCQPAEVQTPVPLPAEIEVWGIDSGIRHAVTGAAYRTVRTGAFMGYRILAKQMKFPTTFVDDGHVLIDDPLWQGYLANISPSLWEMYYRHHLPKTLDGATFLKHYEGITDMVTEVESTRVYPVRSPTAHPIYEHSRVRLFSALLMQPTLSKEHLTLLGELMYQSHASYSACGLGSAGTDRIVALVGELGTQSGLYGAKITGGGNGGTVAILTKYDSEEAIAKIVAQYEDETGLAVTVFRGSSSGALAWGWSQLQKYE
jgi:L-arabinokinase